MTAESNSNGIPPPQGSKPDQRYFPRWQVKNRIVYRLEGEAKVHEACSCDLSCTGVSLIGGMPLVNDQKLKLQIYLTEDKSVEVEGHPVWTKETEAGHVIGINFTNLNTAIQDKILEYAFELNKKDIVKHWFEGWNNK